MQIASYHWNFGDDTGSNEKDPVHDFDPGVYSITLTVYDECGCSSSVEKKVEIVKPGLQLNCPTVTCEDAIEVYTLEGPPYLNGEVNCPDYKWMVEGGTILNQNEDWVEVRWDKIGEDGFGYIYFDQTSCDVTCDNLLAAKIPVITEKGTIQGGKNKLCADEQSRYKLPQWPTTDFQWKVYDNIGNIYPDAVILTDQRNEIVVDASGLDEGNYTLRSDYTNTLHQCGGKAEFKFEVRQDLEIDTTHPTEVCEGDAVDFSVNNPNTNVTWKVVKNNQTVGSGTSGPNNPFNFLFQESGHYVLIADAPNLCEKNTSVDVYEIPSVEEATLEGPEEVCPVWGEEFTFEGDTEGFYVQWEAEHANFLGPDIGETVTIAFEPGHEDYEIKAHLVNTHFNDCVSESVTREVHRFVSRAEILSIEETDTFCTSSYSDFEVGYPTGVEEQDWDSDYFKWSIEPDELARVSTGQGEPEATILFNELYQGQSEGTIKVEAKVCGKMEIIDTFDFYLITDPDLNIDAPESVCAKDTFQVVVYSDPPLSNSSAEIIFGTDDPIIDPVSGIPDDPSEAAQFTFPNIELPNLEPDTPLSVPYTIILEGSDCGQVSVSGSITVNPKPIINVSYDENLVFCNPASINTVFYASVQGGGVGQNDMEWHYVSPSGTNLTLPDDNPLSVADLLNNQTLINQGFEGFGKYWAIATNTYGCTTTTEPITLLQNCDPPPEPCVIDEETTLTAEWINCGGEQALKLTGTYTTNTGTPANTSFFKNNNTAQEHAQFTGGSSTGNTDIQYVKASTPGIYKFGYQVDYAGCSIFAYQTIVINYKPLLRYDISCGSGQYQVELINNSSIHSGVNDVEVTYHISGTDGDGNPVNMNLGPYGMNDMEFNQVTTGLDEGNYTFEISLNRPGSNDPICTDEREVHLEFPNAEFSIVDGGSPPYCAEQTLQFVPDHPLPGATYEWKYQDATNTLETIEPNLLGEENVTIELTITGPYGCVAHYESDAFEVKEAKFFGNIKGDPEIICPGGLSELSYLPDIEDDNLGGYQWYKIGNPNLIGTGPTLDVGDFGEYALHLEDENGCVYGQLDNIYINQPQPPILMIDDETQYCEGEGFGFYATLYPEGSEYRIYPDGQLPSAQWTEGPAVDFTNDDLTPGVYTYWIDYRDVQTGCVESESFTVRQKPEIHTDYSIKDCSPYEVILTATAQGDGLYTWSDGQEGQEITVNHGGPYSVRYQPFEDYCGITDTIKVPKSPDAYTWIFPDGCFEYCRTKNPPYIIGPIPEFNYYSWDLDGVSQSSGTGQVNDYTSMFTGGLNLILDNGECEISTDTLEIDYGKGCNVKCEIEFRIANISVAPEGPYLAYHIMGLLQNNYSFPVNVAITSLDGLVLQSPFYLDPGQNIVFTPNDPLIFISTNGFTGGNAQLEIEGSGIFNGQKEIICRNAQYVTFPGLNLNQGFGKVEINVSPNPLHSTTEVAYQITEDKNFDRGKIELYNLSGMLLQTRNLKTSEGNEQFDLSGYAAGNYILLFYQNGSSLGQKIIVKK